MGDRHRDGRGVGSGDHSLALIRTASCSSTAGPHTSLCPFACHNGIWLSPAAASATESLIATWRLNSQSYKLIETSCRSDLLPRTEQQDQGKIFKGPDVISGARIIVVGLQTSWRIPGWH